MGERFARAVPTRRVGPRGHGAARHAPSGELLKIMNRPCDQFKADMAGQKDGSWPTGYVVNEYRTIAVASAAVQGVASRWGRNWPKLQILNPSSAVSVISKYKNA